MDFAANAVADVIAPPARTPNARSGRAGGEDRSFDDHLDRAAPPEAPEQPTPPEATALNEQTPAETPAPVEADATTNTADASASTETPAPAFVVQIMAPPAQTPVTGEAAAPELKAEAPSAPQAPLPPTPSPSTDGETQNANAAQAAPTQPAKSEAKSDGEASAPAQQIQQTPQARAAAPVLASSADGAPAPVSAPPTPAPAAATTQTTQTATIASINQPAAAQAPREAPQTRSAKPDAAQSAKTDAQPVESTEKSEAPQQAKSAQSASAQNGEAKSAPATPQLSQSAPQLTDANAAQTNSLAQISITPTHASQATSHVEHAARAAPASAQVAREIVRQFDGENTRFELRLDPPELGRVEVRMEVSRDHRVSAVVTADNPQALAELARHARDLEQMLQSSGLELTDNGLSFDLRQGGDSDAEAGDGASNSARGGDVEPETQTAQQARPLGFERWRGVRVDIIA